MADEATPTPGASEGDPSAAGAANPGASAEGSPSGTDSTATADSLAAERARLEATNRELQAAKDRERSERERLERELAQLRGQSAPTTPEAQATPAVDPKAFYAEVQKFGRLEAKATALRDTYKHADAALFDRAIEFDSEEALEAALRASHEAKASVIQAEVDAQVAAKLQEAAGRYGITLTAPATTPETPAGEPSLEQWAAMSMDEQDAWEAKSPGITDRLIRSAHER